MQPLAEQRTKSFNNPRDSISWYQSVAFSRWLTQRLHGTQLPHPNTVVGTRYIPSANMPVDNTDPFIIGENAVIRLPLEWEWQWAAMGGIEQREFPWGAWLDGYANTNEAGLGRALGVGLYPHGAAKGGALDMAGSLWEWCLNDYNNIRLIEYSNDEYKVRRGGSFDHFQDLARCANRHGYGPRAQNYLIGVRLLVALPYRQ